MVWWTECRCERSLDVVEATPLEPSVDGAEREKQFADALEATLW